MNDFFENFMEDLNAELSLDEAYNLDNRFGVRKTFGEVMDFIKLFLDSHDPIIYIYDKNHTQIRQRPGDDEIVMSIRPWYDYDDIGFDIHLDKEV